MKVDVISGFLGAGKTTLIKHLLAHAGTGDRIVVIENEFGEENIDARELDSLEVTIEEFTSGCICCSLETDLAALLARLGNAGNVDRVVIEPTGIALLSKVLGLLETGRIPGAQRNLAVVVLDVVELLDNAGNFGKFYADQIAHAEIILLTKITSADAKDIEFGRHYARTLNQSAVILEDPVETLTLARLEEIHLRKDKFSCQDMPHKQAMAPLLQRSQPAGVHHHSSDGFTSITLQPTGEYTPGLLKVIFTNFSQGYCGNIVRAKGYVRGKGGFACKVDFVLGSISVQQVSENDNKSLVIIGKNLNEQVIAEILN